MYWKDRAVLVQTTLQRGPDGYKVPQTTRRAVFCNRKSASRAEFYAAKQAGDRIALALEVRGADYQGETAVELDGRLYEVVRAYTKNGETFELNCKEAPETEATHEPEPNPDGSA